CSQNGSPSRSSRHGSCGARIAGAKHCCDAAPNGRNVTGFCGDFLWNQLGPRHISNQLSSNVNVLLGLDGLGFLLLFRLFLLRDWHWCDKCSELELHFSELIVVPINTGNKEPYQQDSIYHCCAENE